MNVIRNVYQYVTHYLTDRRHRRKMRHEISKYPQIVEWFDSFERGVVRNLYSAHIAVIGYSSERCEYWISYSGGDCKYFKNLENVILCAKNFREEKLKNHGDAKDAICTTL